MDVVVAGGHGQIALALLRILVQRGDRARGLIRNPDQAAELEDLGAEAVVCDMEAEPELAAFVEGAEAVVFAAGAGPGSGPERKRTVDLGAAVKLVAAAHAVGARRYVIVSSIGAGDPSQGSEEMRPYLQAKHEADEAVATSGLDFTVVRPGRLTDDAGTGRVAAGPDLPRGDVAREDVAAVIAACLTDAHTVGKTFVLVEGDDPIGEALAAL